jgi:hypothetical protein
MSFVPGARAWLGIEQFKPAGNLAQLELGRLGAIAQPTAGSA